MLLNTFKCIVMAYVLVACAEVTPPVKNSETPNFLFIIVDDLRPEIAAYGAEDILTPNIDSLAEEGLIFTRAYANVPVCGASRASLLSGVRPGYNRFLYHYSKASVEVKDVTTLPEHLRINGYTTISIGKVFHSPADNEASAWSKTPFRLDHRKLEDESWSDAYWQNYVTQENIDKSKLTRGYYAMPWEVADEVHEPYFDELYTDEAIRHLHDFAKSGQSFFLSLGFLKPHLPFNAKKKSFGIFIVLRILILPKTLTSRMAHQTRRVSIGMNCAATPISRKRVLSMSS